jgi:hypothetical protein
MPEKPIELKPSHADGIALSLPLFCAGAAAVFLAWRIPVAGLGANHDPGPAVFPLMLGLILMAGAVFEFLRSRTIAGKKGGLAIPEEIPHGAAVVEMEAEEEPDSAGLKNVPLLAGSFFIYLLALPWLGFFPATWIYATLLMWRLGTRLPVAGGATLILLLAVYGLFVRVFKVPLP